MAEQPNETTRRPLPLNVRPLSKPPAPIPAPPPRVPLAIPAAPACLDEPARAVWMELAPSIAENWRPGYAAALELASVLLSRFRRDPDTFTPAKIAQLRAALGDLGLTPRAARLIDRER